MDIFTWSIPFVAEKVIEMLFHVVKGAEDEPLEEDDLDEDEVKGIPKNQLAGKLVEKKGIYKNKVQFVSKMLKMQRVLREERETIIQLKNKYNGLPKGILLEGAEGIYWRIYN